MGAAATQLEHDRASVDITNVSGGRRRLRIKPKPGFRFSPFLECETAYPLELLECVLDVKGPEYLCDEIFRDERYDYVGGFLEKSLLSYVSPTELEGSTILDFGCGSGASTLHLAKLLPKSNIVGVELVEEFVDLATKRIEYYELSNARVIHSKNSRGLPDTLPDFDHVVMSAVYEHLLPDERGTLLQTLWERISPGGLLFINQTPYRHFPIESHTTGLPFLNYLPDQLALPFARRFSKRLEGNESWEKLLRMGIRGADDGEIEERLASSSSGRPVWLEPTRMGLSNRVELWYLLSTTMRRHPAKRVMKTAFSLIHRATGRYVLPSLTVAIRKS